MINIKKLLHKCTVGFCTIDMLLIVDMLIVVPLGILHIHEHFVMNDLYAVAVIGFLSVVQLLINICYKQHQHDKRSD